MSNRTITVWTPKGDVLLNAKALQEVLGGSVSIVNTAIATIGAGTLTAAGLIGGLITRTGSTAAYTDTTATAAQIVTALGGFFAGQTFTARIKNGTGFPQTIAAGAGVTLPASITIPPFSMATYIGTVGGTSASPTVTLVHTTTVPINVASATANPSALALTTVGAGTITAAGFNAGVTARSGATSAFTDTTDTAANLVAGVSALIADNSAVEWTYVNNTVAPATLAGGVGVTISGQTIIPANSWATYLVFRTSATAVVLTCIGQGYFPKTGTFIANGATPVTVTDAAITAGSAVTITLKTVGGTVGALPRLVTVTPGTGFNVNCTASDTSTYNYEIRG